jgi:alanine racemase
MSGVVSEHLAGAVLSIDLDALKRNFATLARKAKGAECAAAIKGEAYGIGMARASRALWAAGCRTFFVARPREGQELRGFLPEAVIYVLDGLYAGQAAYYIKHKLRPALSSVDQVREWETGGRKQPCALHFDTGINRLGLKAADATAMAQDKTLMKQLNVALIMSHLACSDSPSHRMNRHQLGRFLDIRKLFPGVPASFANSSGIFLGQDYCFDQVRPGVALYGGNPVPGLKNPMRAVATLEANVLQVREVRKGETVGYSATWKTTRDSRIAILGAGYRDGIPRKLSSSKADGPAQVWLAGQRFPIVGRVSMDMMCVDVTAAKKQIKRGMQAELFGPHISVDEAAGWAGTISYELLTHLGNRYARVYSGFDS